MQESSTPPPMPIKVNINRSLKIDTTTRETTKKDKKSCSPLKYKRKQSFNQYKTTTAQRVVNEPFERAEHLIVGMHGLHGEVSDWLYFQHTLEVAHNVHCQHDGSTPLVHFLSAKSNQTSLCKTHDGVDAGGIRLADEIQEKAQTMPKLRYFSIIGHSLGGLYIRYAIGVLHARQFFEKVQPLNFLSMATPNLGIRRPDRGPFNKIFNTVSPFLFSRTGAHMTLTDTDLSPYTIELATASRTVSTACEQHGALSEATDPLHTGYAYCSTEDASFQGHVAFCTIDTNGFEMQLVHSSNENREKTTYRRSWSPASTITCTPSDNGGSQLKIYFESSKSDQITLLFSSSVPTPCEVHMEPWLSAFLAAGVGSAPSRNLEAGPLLLCMTTGHFLYGLEKFKYRSLYSNVFYDFQVPYSSAAIRSHNPYRGDTTGCPRSGIYRHLTLQSLSTANTNYELHVQPMIKASNTSASFSLNLWWKGDDKGPKQRGASPSSIAARRNKPVSVSFKSPPSVVTVKKGQGQLILDRNQEAFCSDAKRAHILRSMLLNLQSIHWKRFDSIIEGVSSHERIIAKRAWLYAPENSGLDIVCHAVDTFAFQI